MRLNICIDIDGTITDPYYWIKYINEYFKTNLSAEDITKFDICRILNITNDEYLKFYDVYGEKIHSSAVLRQYVKDMLNEINNNHNIYYITARPEKYREVTSEWIKVSGLPRGELFMMGNHNKEEKAKELDCHIFIEDRYRNAVMLAKAGFKVLLIDSNYNRYPLIDGIKRVYNWKEIYDEISS